MKIMDGSIPAVLGRNFWWISPFASATTYLLFGHVLPYVSFYPVDGVAGPLYANLLHGLKYAAPYVAVALLMPLPVGFFVRWRRRSGNRSAPDRVAATGTTAPEG
jgi:hypothetical protein